MEINEFKQKIGETLCGKYEKFADLLEEYNQKFNITSITDREEVWIKHFLDSVIPEKYFPCGAKVAEIGSGGGFPSVPLKIIRDDLKFTLIESTAKKCDFLNIVKSQLGFENFEVLNVRAEEGARKDYLRDKFDAVCARAVAKLNTLCEYCLPYLAVGGVFVAYKGDADEEIKEAQNAVITLGGKLEEIEKYLLPDGSKRCAVVIKKVKPTPEKYPRGRGLERKKPL